jgi:hypothetical protein
MNTIRIIQNGTVISDGVYTFRGVRILTGTIGEVLCYFCVMGGSKSDNRCGKKLTPRSFGGAFTVQVINPSGEVISTFGIATVEQVAAHPRCTAVAASVRS